jgi:hypothetical protein
MPFSIESQLIFYSQRVSDKSSFIFRNGHLLNNDIQKHHPILDGLEKQANQEDHGPNDADRGDHMTVDHESSVSSPHEHGSLTLDIGAYGSLPGSTRCSDASPI